MGSTKINVGAVMGLSHYMLSAQSTAKGVQDSINSMRYQIDGQILNRNNISARLTAVSSQVERIASRINSVKTVAENGANSYYRTEQLVVSWKDSVSDNHIQIDSQVSGKVIQNNNPFEWNWKDTLKIISSAGIGGSIISTIGGLLTGGKPAEKIINTGKNLSKVVENIAKAIPKSSETSFDWKTLFGFQKAITADTPKTFFGALGKSVDGLKFGNAKTVTDKIAVGAKWAGYAFTAATTIYDNFTDTEENNSFGRKVAESVGETTVKIGEGLLIGAAVTSTLAACSVGAPVVVVGAITVGVTWAIDSVCEAITGKDAAELISDAVLDTGKKVVEGVGKAAKKVKEGITGWWKKTFG